MRVRATSVLLTTVSAALLVLAACRSDGRDMRPPTAPLPAPTTTTTEVPQPDQLDVGQPIVTGPVATAAPAVELLLLTPWPDGSAIPARYTCDGENVSPALSWTPVAGAVELAITVTDLDADGFVHWIVTGIDPITSSIAENGDLPVGAVVGPNSFGTSGYGGPCPPEGDEAHTYSFTLHALNQQLESADGDSANDVITLLNQIAFAQSSVSGTYARAG